MCLLSRSPLWCRFSHSPIFRSCRCASTFICARKPFVSPPSVSLEARRFAPQGGSCSLLHPPSLYCAHVLQRTHTVHRQALPSQSCSPPTPSRCQALCSGTAPFPLLRLSGSVGGHCLLSSPSRLRLLEHRECSDHGVSTRACTLTNIVPPAPIAFTDSDTNTHASSPRPCDATVCALALARSATPRFPPSLSLHSLPSFVACFTYACTRA